MDSFGERVHPFHQASFPTPASLSSGPVKAEETPWTPREEGSLPEDAILRAMRSTQVLTGSPAVSTPDCPPPAICHLVTLGLQTLYTRQPLIKTPL